MDQQKDKSMSLEDSNYMQYHNEQTDRQTRLRNPCHGKILTYSLYSSEQIDVQTDRQIHVTGRFLLIACFIVNTQTKQQTDRQMDKQTDSWFGFSHEMSFGK